MKKHHRINHKTFIVLFSLALVLLMLCSCGSGSQEGGNKTTAANLSDEELDSLIMKMLQKDTNDYSEEKDILEQLSDQGNSKADYYLGYIYANGSSSVRNMNKSKEYYLKACKAGNMDAAVKLALMLIKPYATSDEIQKGKEYLEQAENDGSPSALIGWAKVYKDGYMSLKEDVDPESFAKKAIEEITEPILLSDAFSILGSIYGPKDRELSTQYYEKACNFGNADAYAELGSWYASWQDGVEEGEEDYGTVLEYYEKGAKKGSSIALIALSDYYINWTNVDHDYDKGIAYLEQAVELHDCSAMVVLGYYYQSGDIVEKDYSKAKYYYEKAAKDNYGPALYYLGNMYEKGLGVDVDKKKADEYYKKAKDRGIMDSEE